MATVADQRNSAACLLLAGYEVANDSQYRRAEFDAAVPHPHPQNLEKVSATTPEGLVAEAEQAIRLNDQAQAAAIVAKYGQLGLPERPVFNLLLKYAISEDGALHAEKYYRTVTEEFAASRPAFRWRQLTALARVTASEFGRPAPGITQAKELLGV
jgi:hypothetical protein